MFGEDHHSPQHGLKLQPSQSRVSSFFPLSSDATFSTDYPLSEGNLSNIVVYSGDTLRDMLGDRKLKSTDDKFNELASEFTRVLDKGPGVLVIKNCFDDHSLLDKVTTAFEGIITEEKESKVAGDHFSGAGNSSRIWNAQEKLAVVAPELYVPYYNNKLLSAVSLAWLGPYYQMTSQVNSSHPGSAAQDPHCDYHLGFRSDEQVIEYPNHVHTMSQYLTLQGAIAHVDMPIESGPTTFLPYSQNFERNYLTWRDEKFKEYYKQRHCQLPLDKGDAVFFNPGLIHAAGDNLSENVDRTANLVQVNSCFGLPMETVDRKRATLAVYNELLRTTNEVGHGDPSCVRACLMSTAMGNSFPTNLDRDVPQGSNPPPSMFDRVYEGLMMKWDVEEMRKNLDEHERLRVTH